MKSLFTPLSLVAVLMLSACSSCPLGNKVTASGKIEHIVLVWLKRPSNAEDRATLVATAKKFQAEISEIQHLSVGAAVASDRDIVDDTFDVGFVMRFADKATLTAYENHPTHKDAVKKILLPLAKKVLVYDIGCK